MNSLRFNLNLEKSASSCKRQLTLHSNYLLANGGSNGTITSLDMNTVINVNSSPVESKNNSISNSAFRVIKQFDDAVCALAFSSDGLRVAVGYDNGQVRIFMFTKEQVESIGDDGTTGDHPFILNTKKRHPSNGDDGASLPDRGDDEDDEDDLLDDMLTMTQTQTDDNFEPNVSSSSLGSLSSSFVLSRRFDSEVRCLSFQPVTGNKYYLGIALESSPGFTVADVTSSTNEAFYLEQDSIAQYQQAGVRHLSFSPDGQTLATLGCDGRLCIWNTPSKNSSDPELDWELYHADKFNVAGVDAGIFAEVGDKAMACIWSPDGNVLGVSGSKDLQIRRKCGEANEADDDNSWLKKDRLVLASDAEVGEIVAIAFDPLNLGFVVTSFKTGQVGIWKLKDDVKNEEESEGTFLGFLELAKSNNNETNITTNDSGKRLHEEVESQTKSACTHIVWGEKGSTEFLHLAMDNGSLFMVNGRDQIITSQPKNTMKNSLLVATEGDVPETQEFEFETQPNQSKSDVKANAKKRLKKKFASTARGNDNHDISHDSDDEDDILFDTDAEADHTAVGRNLFLADEADEEDGNEISGSNSLDEEGNNSTQDVADDDNHSHENTDAFDHSDDIDLNDDNNDFRHTQELVAALPEPQAPFAPSSTPIGTSRRRILCWNHHGVITSREGEGLQRFIDFSFVDSASRRPASFRDPYNLIIGTFGEEGGLFASDLREEEEDDDGFGDDLFNGMSDTTKAVVKKSGRRNIGKKDRATGSNIYFHRFETFGSAKDKDWHLALPEGEQAVGCASGKGWNAVATNRRFLRLFSTSGMQGPVVWLKGDVVTIVGRGRFLSVMHHEANPLTDGTQKIGYTIFDGVTAKVIAEGSVSALSPGSSLMWAGFSSDSSLCVTDQEGIVSMLVLSKTENQASMTGKWVPLLDTLGLKKSREDHFWPVSIQNAKLVCVPLKGTKHPDATRRPLTTAFQMRLPLARGIGGRSIVLDEVSVRANLALENKQAMIELNVFSNQGDYAAEVEDEYEELCKKVDKVTLKLFFSLVDNGEPGIQENAFDLVRRLHFEKSYDLAVKAADMRGLTKLSDRILDSKEERFDDVDDDEDPVGEPSSNESINYTPTDHPPVQRRKVSPISSTKRKERDENEEVDSENDMPEPKLVPRRRANPFAKKLKESPPKSIMDSPLLKKPTLSRMSTFSAESRQKSKLTKHFL